MKNTIPKIKNPSDLGYFYVLQLNPESNPNRIKLGFTVSLKNRLIPYLTSNPNAKYIEYRECRRHWEKTIIELLIHNISYIQVGTEVFDFANINQFLIKFECLFGVILNDYNQEDYIYP